MKKKEEFSGINKYHIDKRKLIKPISHQPQ